MAEHALNIEPTKNDIHKLKINKDTCKLMLIYRFQ